MTEAKMTMSETGKTTHLGRATAVISGMTVISRVSGLLRDKCIAFVFGAGAVTDAFFVAFRIPDLLRGLLAEGSLSASFIPLFTEEDKQRSEAAAWQLGSAALTVMTVVLAAVALLGIALAPWLVRLFTLEFGAVTSPQFGLTVKLTRTMFPFLIFVGLAALVMGMLNARRKFAVPAFAPVMLNLALIAGAVWVAPRLGPDPATQIFGLAAAVLVGGLLQLAVQVPALLKLGFRYRLTVRHPALKRLFALMLPGTVGLMVAEVGLMVDTMLAWNLGPGAVSALYWGNRLMQLPLGIFGIAIATAMLPTLAGEYIAHRIGEFKRTLTEGVRLMLAIQVPAIVALIVLARPIIRVLLQGGAFSAADTGNVAWALICFSLGLCSYAGVKIFVQAFYAMQDTRTPVKLAVASLLLNIALNLVLIVPLGFAGLALATALAATFNCVALVILLRRRLGRLRGREVAAVLVRIAAASAGMGAVLLALVWLRDPAGVASLLAAGLLLTVYIGLGLGVYLGLGTALKVAEVGRLSRLGLRLFAPRPPAGR